MGSLPVEARNPQTLQELRLVASREGTTIEQVMSKACNGFSRLPTAVQGNVAPLTLLGIEQKNGACGQAPSFTGCK